MTLADEGDATSLITNTVLMSVVHLYVCKSDLAVLPHWARRSFRSRCDPKRARRGASVTQTNKANSDRRRRSGVDAVRPQIEGTFRVPRPGSLVESRSVSEDADTGSWATTFGSPTVRAARERACPAASLVPRQHHTLLCLGFNEVPLNVFCCMYASHAGPY